MEEIRLTTWDVQNLVNNGINYVPTGEGVLPSTVVWKKDVVLECLRHVGWSGKTGIFDVLATIQHGDTNVVDVCHDDCDRVQNDLGDCEYELWWFITTQKEIHSYT